MECIITTNPKSKAKLDTPKIQIYDRSLSWNLQIKERVLNWFDWPISPLLVHDWVREVFSTCEYIPNPYI